MKKRKPNRAGFTLTELMITVAIVAVLASVGVPTYRRMLSKARQAEVPVVMSVIHRSLQVAQSEFNRYPTGSDITGLATPNGLGAIFVAIINFFSLFSYVMVPDFSTATSCQGTFKVEYENCQKMFYYYLYIPGNSGTDYSLYAIERNASTSDFETMIGMLATSSGEIIEDYTPPEVSDRLVFPGCHGGLDFWKSDQNHGLSHISQDDC